MPGSVWKRDGSPPPRRRGADRLSPDRDRMRSHSTDNTIGDERDPSVPKLSYPALFDPVNNSLHALLGSASYVIGRSETADVTVLDPSCSRQQFRIVRV